MVMGKIEGSENPKRYIKTISTLPTHTNSNGPSGENFDHAKTSGRHQKNDYAGTKAILPFPRFRKGQCIGKGVSGEFLLGRGSKNPCTG